MTPQSSLGDEEDVGKGDASDDFEGDEENVANPGSEGDEDILTEDDKDAPPGLGECEKAGVVEAEGRGRELCVEETRVDCEVEGESLVGDEKDEYDGEGGALKVNVGGEESEGEVGALKVNVGGEEKVMDEGGLKVNVGREDSEEEGDTV